MLSLVEIAKVLGIASQFCTEISKALDSLEDGVDKSKNTKSLS